MHVRASTVAFVFTRPALRRTCKTAFQAEGPGLRSVKSVGIRWAITGAYRQARPLADVLLESVFWQREAFNVPRAHFLRVASIASARDDTAGKSSRARTIEGPNV